MSVSLGCMVNILQIELKEVENDLHGLEKLYTNRHDSSEITNYVFLENSALLRSEIASIHKLGDFLSDFKIDDTLTPHETLDLIDEYIQRIVKEKQFSRAIYEFAKSKIAKVSKYVDM